MIGIGRWKNKFVDDDLFRGIMFYHCMLIDVYQHYDEIEIGDIEIGNKEGTFNFMFDIYG